MSRLSVTENRWLLLSTHSGSWGDGLFGVRAIKQEKQRLAGQGEFSTVYYCAHEHEARLIGGMLVHEGLIDDLVSYPHEFTQGDSDSQTETMIRFLRRRYGLLHFSRVFLTYVPNVNMLEILSLPMFRDAEIMALCMGDEYRKQGIVLETLDVRNVNTAWTAYSIQEEIDGLFSRLEKKPAVAFMPESTRRLNALHPEGVRRILDALAPHFNVLLLGLERALYSVALWDGTPELTERDLLWMEQAGFLEGAYNLLGWSSVKQAEILRRCVAAVVTSTGAICLPEMIGVPMVIVEGGNYSIEGLCHFGNAPYTRVLPKCPYYICCTGTNAGETKTILSECESNAPKCLNQEVDGEQVKKAVMLLMIESQLKHAADQ